MTSGKPVSEAKIVTDIDTINFSTLFKDSTMHEMGLRRGH